MSNIRLQKPVNINPLAKIIASIEKCPDEFKELNAFMNLLDEDGKRFVKPLKLSRLDSIDIDTIVATIPRLNDGTDRENLLNQMIEKIPPMIVMDQVDFV